MTGKSEKAGFWRRLAGLLIDGVIMGVVGFVAATAGFDILAGLPGPTRLIGLVVGVLYFGILCSGAGGGRTLGMRAAGAKVVRTDGQPLSLGASLWRALLLQGPFMLNGLMLSGLDRSATLAYSVVAAFAVFGVSLANVVLVLGNRHTGRLVHDLLSGAIVVRSDTETPPTGETRGAIVFAVVVAVLAGVAPLALSPVVKTSAPLFNDLSKTQAAVAQLPGVLDVGVNENTTTFFTGGGGAKRTLIVTARVKAWPKDEQAFADQVGAVVRRTYPLKPDQEIQVELRRGYDIGVAQGWSSHGFTPRPAAPV